MVKSTIKVIVLYFSSILVFFMASCNKDEAFVPDPVIISAFEWRISGSPDYAFPVNGLDLGFDSAIWACGDSGSVYYSNDNGLSWERKVVISGYNLHDIAIHGWGIWVCGSDGLLIRTEDNWVSSDTIALSIDYNLYDLYFANSTDAWMVGSPDNTGNSMILQSKNGGNTWQSHPCGAEEILKSVHAIGGSTWAVGMNGIFVYSLDTAQTWEVDTLAGGKHLKKVHFTDSIHGFIAGEGGLLLRTEDAGRTWSEINAFTLTDLNDIYFLNPDEGWICGEQGKVFHTTDGGLNWKVENTHSSGSLRKIMFRDPKQGLTVGAGTDNKALSIVYQLFKN
jgi:photosystem II stability/assembly factor-like uncharacterized protein